MSFVSADFWAKLIETNPRFAGNVEMARFDAKGRIGTWTTEEKKHAFMLEIQRTVPGLKFASEFVTQRVDPKSIQSDLIDQMHHFRLDIVAPKTENSTAHEQVPCDWQEQRQEGRSHGGVRDRGS